MSDFVLIFTNGRLEILADQPDVDCILVSVGGGGVIGGMAAYIKKHKPSCQV